MLHGQSLLKVLIVGEDEEIRNWIRNTVTRMKLPWRVRFTCPLRICAPENQLIEQDLIVVLWERTMPIPIEEILKRKSITTRSVEGVISEIDTHAGEDKMRRTIVLASQITREDTVFLAEYGVKVVYALPPKRSHWEKEGAEFVKRMQRLHDEESMTVDNPEENAARTFIELLGFWGRLSDETKMDATENLLRVLGDSSRYAELIARKCLKENDPHGAEQWLHRAIGKNQNYMKAMQLLADVHLSMGNFKDALTLLERLKANNPRNFIRLTKIGRCYLAMGEYQKAEKVIGDALSIDEFYKEAREELGKIKCVLGDFDAAKVLLADSKNGRKLATFLNTMGIRLVESRRFAESIEHYKRAQYVLPGNDSGHQLFFNIGLAYAKWGRLAEARKYIRLALIREPSYDKAVNLLKSIDERLSA